MFVSGWLPVFIVLLVVIVVVVVKGVFVVFGIEYGAGCGISCA